jgi:signal transduction histidine kinase
VRTLFPERLGRRVGYLLLTLPLGIFYFALLIAGLLSAVGGAFIIGIPLFIALMYFWRLLARFERRLVRAGLGVDIPDPYRAPSSETRLGRVRDRATDPATWKDLAYLLLMFPMGLVSFTVVLSLAATALGFLTMAAWGWYAIPGGHDLGFITVDTIWEALLVTPLCVPVWLIFLLAVRGLVSLHIAVARSLLSASPDPEMTARVTALQDSRARIIAAADAERRRLERDLHDGAQQRLVTLGIVLRRLQRSLPSGAKVLAPAFDAAVDEVAATIADLRTIAAGVRPPRLDEGLAAALEDLARGAAVPVEVEASGDRAPPEVEAVAYFIACEALTNAVKHASPSRVSVQATRADGVLRLVVADDGIGGASSAAGTGLAGMADRVAAQGGTLALDSPAGAGTRIAVELPCAS